MHDAPHVDSRPVIFGEVLFDCFPDGQDILGGAPFNVAWHLVGFGLNPVFISRIGDDPLGEQVIEAMTAWGMDTRFLQRDEIHPTGRVRIEMDGSSHRFDILADQAYDHISLDELAPLAGQPTSLIYAGSLITRGETARASLLHLLDESGARLFLDINLRAPWWHRDAVMRLLRAASWGKLNDEELTEMLARDIPEAQIMAVASEFRETLGLDTLVLTRGPDGACLITDTDQPCARPPQVTDIIDTVGAGDAFSSVTILGFLRGWSLDVTLNRALEFAAAVCTQRGATAPDRELYSGFLSRWEQYTD